MGSVGKPRAGVSPALQTNHTLRHPGISSLPISVQHHDMNNQEGKSNRRYTIILFPSIIIDTSPPTPFTRQPRFSLAASCLLNLSIAYLIRRRQWSLTEDSERGPRRFIQDFLQLHPINSRRLSVPASTCLSLVCFYEGCPPHSVSISYYVSFSILVKVMIYYDDFPLFSSILFSFHRRRMVL